MNEDNYPTERLKDIESALLLFGCGFQGKNDGQFVREAGVPRVTVVDNDPLTLETMREAYPEHWRFILTDAFTFARLTPDKWDVVSADLPSNLPVEMVDALPLWCSAAKRTVISTVMRHNFPWGVNLDQLPPAPEGWRYADLIQRSGYRGGAYWLVTEAW